jgi:hypothetical protein
MKNKTLIFALTAALSLSGTGLAFAKEMPIRAQVSSTTKAEIKEKDGGIGYKKTRPNE